MTVIDAYNEGLTLPAIARLFGAPMGEVRAVIDADRAKTRLPQQARPSAQSDRAASASHLPTPDDIERACEEIQSGWSARERRRRNRLSHGAAIRWKPPVIQLSS